MWRPIASRSPEPAARALAEQLQKIIELKDDTMLLLALKSVGDLKITGATSDLTALVQDTNYSPQIRARSLQSLSRLDAKDTVDLAIRSLDDSQHLVRTAARQVLLGRGHEAAVGSLIAALDADELRERQAAYELLAQSTLPEAAQAVEAKLQQLIAGDLPADTRLDLVLSARAWCDKNPNIAGLLDQYNAADPDTVTREFRDCLEGGDAIAGRQVFFEKLQVYCLRCHRIADQGGAVGPDLTAIGSKKDRKYLMESIVDPNRAIAENYETVVIINDLGKTISGVLQSETDDFLRLTTAEGSLVSVAKSSIDERRRGKSSMPEDLVQHLTPREVRDLVEFLTQQGNPQAGRQASSEVIADAPGDQ
jgi:quinoprotein glucose dehydrogenase